MNEQSKKEMAESLWREINRAIINSSRVRLCLNSMKEKEILDYLCEHDFLLDGKKLISEMLDEPDQMNTAYQPSEMEKKLQSSLDMFLGEQGQPISSIKSTMFPRRFFSSN
jgi:hypothetical protein